MSHYKSNLRDIEFNLFEVLGRDEVLGQGPFAEIDRDTAEAILAEVNTLAETKLAASFVEGDKNPPVFDPKTNTVTMPQEFADSYKAWMDSEFFRLELPEGLGGNPAPPSLTWAVAELVLGSNPAIHMYAAGPKFGQVVFENGTERDKKIARHMVDRTWGATMVLTEPDAGSDVGAGRTKATQQEDGSWHIEGVKRFITSGEQEMTENIMHLVLARPVGVEGHGGPGTKGLSLFLVPKYHFDVETGELTGERNGAFVTGVEHKMGLKVSTTCELTFGGTDIPAKGWLLGEVHNGIKQMFQVIEYARMMVGTKAIATLSTGYLNALEYAKTRVQGPDLAQASDKSAPRVTITHHPDVRRSLMTQKAFVEGMRSLVLYAASWQDRVALAKAAGETDELAEKVNDLLLPIVKGYGSERSWVLLGTESLQTFGGSGFLSDYPIEQYVRDAKIDTLYEGTTAIQGQDLFFRKIVRDNGQALGHLSGQIAEWIGADADGQLKEERKLLQRGLEDAGMMVGLLVQQLQSSVPGAPEGDPRNVYKVGLNTSRVLMALGDVVVSWLLLRGAETALAKLNGEVSAADKAFYTGKVAAARWFASTVLPKLTAERKIAERTTLEVMDIPEDAF
ncbi:acyl-CoA dehydrogenase [Propionibacteriaceae bacterium Y1685]